ncbi:MAG: hypothetical protein ABI629_22960 [bacterium]
MLTGPALLGRVALGPESVLDRDPLYRVGPAPPSPPTNDFTPINYDLPRDLAVAHGLRAGRLDAWNPLVGFGAPLWAEAGGPFFPLKLPFYVAPSPRSYILFLALRLIVAGLGAYLLARRRGLALVPALVAGVLFEASGALVAQIAFASASPIYVLPWAILGAEAIARGGARAVAGAALALGCAGLGGHPTEVLTIFAAFAVAIGAHATTWWRQPRTMLAIAARGALAVCLGVMLAAPSLLPLAELSRLSSFYRMTDFGDLIWTLFLDQSRRTLPLALFGPSTLILIQGDLPIIFPWALGPTLGVIGLIAAVTGILCRGLDAALASVGILGIGLALMPPGFGWLHQLPGFSLVLPRYAWVLVALPLTQAAGRGVAVLDAPGRHRPALLALATVIAGFASLGLVRDSWPLNYGAALHRVLASREGLARLLVPPALAIAAVASRVLIGPRRRFKLFALLACLEAVVTVAPHCRHPTSVVLQSPPSPAVQFLQARLAAGDGRMLGLPAAIGQPFTPALFGLADIRGVFALPTRRYLGYLDAISPTMSQATVQTVGARRSPLLDLGAVGYVVLARTGSPPAILDNDSEMPLAYSDGQVVVYENRAALPRARVVHQVVHVPDEDAARARLAALGPLSAHAHSLGLAAAVAVEPADDGEVCPALGSASDGDSVRIVDARDPDCLVLHGRLASPGLVVIADTYYPGWRAHVDGTPAAIFPADLLFRAILVPAGEHEIVLTYAPRSLAAGALLSLAAFAVCLVLLSWPRAATPVRRSHGSAAGW